MTVYNYHDGKNWGSICEKLKNNEDRPKFTDSYKIVKACTAGKEISKVKIQTLNSHLHLIPVTLSRETNYVWVKPNTIQNSFLHCRRVELALSW